MTFNEAFEALKEGHAIRRTNADLDEATYYHVFDDMIKFHCGALGRDHDMDGLISLDMEDVYADDWEIADYLL